MSNILSTKDTHHVLDYLQDFYNNTMYCYVMSRALISVGLAAPSQRLPVLVHVKPIHVT